MVFAKPLTEITEITMLYNGFVNLQAVLMDLLVCPAYTARQSRQPDRHTNKPIQDHAHKEQHLKPTNKETMAMPST